MNSLSGWKRNLLAMLLGASAVLILPPFFLLPVAIIAYGGLFWLISYAVNLKRAFWDGFFWGWGYFMAGLYWFTIALLTEPEKFAWLIPFALFGLTAVIAIYIGITTTLFAKIRGKGIVDTILFASIWTFVEFSRGHFFTGFPWNLAGYALMADEGLMQIASVVGIYGMSWILVFLAVLPAALWLRYAHSRKLFALGILLLVGIWGWGQWRLTDDMLGMEARGYVDTVPDVKLRLIQANIAQHHKWDPKLQFEGLRRHVTLSMSEGVEEVTHIIWPETAVPYVIREDSTLTTRIGQMLRPDQHLITGGLHTHGDDIFNSIAIINHQGEIVGRYDKHKLVPFGEFLPLRWLIPDSLETPVGMKDFSAGPGPETLKWQGLPSVSPLICYESIFPELAVGDTRPAFLLNLTNDAWFGLSTGPHQHFHMARLRAVEQGLPLVRVANTGITAVVDSYGRIRGMIELGKEGVLDILLPVPLEQPTFYALNGNLVIYALLMLAALLLIYQKKRLNN